MKMRSAVPIVTLALFFLFGGHALADTPWPPWPRVTNIKIEPTEVYAGDYITATLTIENTECRAVTKGPSDWCAFVELTNGQSEIPVFIRAAKEDRVEGTLFRVRLQIYDIIAPADYVLSHVRAVNTSPDRPDCDEERDPYRDPYRGSYNYSVCYTGPDVRLTVLSPKHIWLPSILN